MPDATDKGFTDEGPVGEVMWEDKKGRVITLIDGRHYKWEKQSKRWMMSLLLSRKLEPVLEDYLDPKSKWFFAYENENRFHLPGVEVS